MGITGRTCLVVTCLLGVVLYRPQLLSSCGPFFARAAFIYTVHPDFPLEKFAAGELGVLQPTYARSYLVVAYRYLTGTGFNAAEQKVLVALWRDRLVSTVEANAEEWTKIWLEARSKVPGIAAVSSINVFRSWGKFSNYLNCPEDAFKTAASTLHRLQERFGPESLAVHAWVQAQDVVFAKCSDGANLTLQPATDPQLQADSAYQMATAQFYSGNFDAAIEAFESIAKDTNSPWRSLAPYLAARALVRKATLGAEEGQVDRAVLEQAEAQVRQILADSEQRAMHPAARRLLQFVHFRLTPTSLLHELAQAVLKKDAPMTLQQDLADYTLLLDKHLGAQADAQASISPASAASATAIKDEALSDWIVTFQGTDQEALAHALAQWEKTSALPWLVAALTKLDTSHAKAAQLVTAATQIQPTSPAFASVAFHRARLLLQAGKQDEVRTYLDTILARGTDVFPVSAVNFLRAVRMQVARNLDEFLTYAQRLPSGITYDEDGRELPTQLFGVATGDVTESLPASAMQAHFDADATRLFNQAVPVSMRKEAVRHPSLAAHLRRELALATWIEAVLLDQVAVAQELAVVVAEQVPELKPYLDAYVAAPENATKKFAAVYLMLKYPGTRPYVDEGIGRPTPLNQIDNYRDNWWCALKEKDKETNAEADNRPGNPLPKMGREAGALDFLTAAQKAAAQAEVQKLHTLDTAPNYLVAQVLAWAKRTPNDPRVPEALHLAIRSTRYGCTDTKTTQFSKQAFQVLHKQYPQSSWAQQTKYWY
jgi:tetratricopeptide (TPR) repeat protein